jgi:hypothetical protein
VKKQRAPALPDSTNFRQLWDALGSRLIESAQGNLLYTQEVTGSNPVPPTYHTFFAESHHKHSLYNELNGNASAA